MTKTPDVFGPTVDSKFPGDDALQRGFEVLAKEMAYRDLYKIPRDPEVRVRFLRVVLAQEEERGVDGPGEASIVRKALRCLRMELHLSQLLEQIPFLSNADEPNSRVRLWILERMASYIPSAWGEGALLVCKRLNTAMGSILYGPPSEVLNLIKRTASRMTSDSLKEWMKIPETPDQVIEALAVIWIRSLSPDQILALLSFPEFRS